MTFEMCWPEGIENTFWLFCEFSKLYTIGVMKHLGKFIGHMVYTDKKLQRTNL